MNMQENSRPLQKFMLLLNFQTCAIKKPKIKGLTNSNCQHAIMFVLCTRTLFSALLTYIGQHYLRNISHFPARLGFLDWLTLNIPALRNFGNYLPVDSSTFQRI